MALADSDPCHHVAGVGTDEIAGISDAWERHAQDWIAWTQNPELDTYHWLLNLPGFVRLVPPAGRLTLDIGCGEGRVGRWLANAGHRVWGIDSSPTLTAHALQAGGYEVVVCGTATELPWPDGCADLAVAFMSLHDMPDPSAAITEVARALEPGGVLCIAIVHPLNRPAEGLREYFTERRSCSSVSRGGLTMTLEVIDRPLRSYTQALAAAGLVIEELREPRANVEAVARAPELAPAARQPFFLHLRCRRA